MNFILVYSRLELNINFVGLKAHLSRERTKEWDREWCANHLSDCFVNKKLRRGKFHTRKMKTIIFSNWNFSFPDTKKSEIRRQLSWFIVMCFHMLIKIDARVKLVKFDKWKMKPRQCNGRNDNVWSVWAISCVVRDILL